MYLKSIEVQGFKSFANKLIFEFHDGITAIVGPNGSGKSNVGDAVRWVLGEQSAKQLRGNKMEDIIFAGTESRKPLGFAYVAITLDNSDHKLPIDYEEVKIARRVFRSGESEYLINGTNCRLKDVQELFLDTGIGKEGYSIIGQGQIEKILSGKPEDRRELFDEAAGIVKFKKRKLAAEKNLEAEKQNLYRINDILSEIEKQVGPLEKQSQVAREYLKYRDELKELDVQMFLLEYERIEQEQKELENKIQIVHHDMKNTTDSYDLAKVEYEKLEQYLDQMNEQIDLKKNGLSEEKVKKEQIEGQIKVVREQIVATQLSDEHFQTRLVEIANEIQKKEQEKEQLEQSFAEFEILVKNKQEQKLTLEQKLTQSKEEIAEYSQKIEDAKSEIFDFLSNNSTVKSNMQRYDTILEQNNIKKVALTQRLVKNKSDEAILKHNIEESSILLNEMVAKMNKKNEETKLQSEKAKELEMTRSNLLAELDTTRQQYHREKSKLESLSNLTERYEGYGNSIRRIMEHKEEYQGVHGVVADIIKVNKEYEVAVETALGGSIQNIVTDNEQTAKRLIEFLKKNRFGRATFLPLTSITNKHSFYNEKALQEPGVIGLASTLVQTEETYRNVVESLLGRILVVKDIDHAIAIAKKYQYSLRIVTMEGEQLNPGGSMSGGAFKNSSNLLGRRREIDDLKVAIGKISTSMEELNIEIQKIEQSRQEVNEFIAENKKQVQELILKHNTEKMKLNQTKVDLQNAIADYEEIQQESNQIEEQATELRKKIEELQLQLAENDAKARENESFILSLEKEVAEKREHNQKIEEEYNNIKMEVSSIEQNHQFNLTNLHRIQDERNRFMQEKERMKENMENSIHVIKEKEQVIQSLQQTKEHLDEVILEIETQIRQMSMKKEEFNTQYKEFFHKREELSNRINTLDKEIYRLTSGMDKLNEQLDYQVNYMWEQYELTYGSATSLRTEEEYNLGTLKKSIQEVKVKIKNLGSINVNAIEEYQNLLERYELLKTQRDDLVKAEEVLRNIILELDTEMRKQFDEKFGQIQKEFDKVFKQLFGGGKGTLELVEDEDILEAGIRINAQPPGKKLQNMMQLSGGEKALTAISLLFAIQNLKPSPFCLLDEIEAALDEQNVDRYANYLSKLTNHTQFIVITHRRGTMNAADRLYGITMQEKGISTLVSVNLIEDELK